MLALFYRHTHTIDPRRIVPRKYPIGISDWKKIREEGYFFWDRKKFIKEFYEDLGEVSNTLIFFILTFTKVFFYFVLADGPNQQH